MGLFDTVYVSGDVAAAFELKCGLCGSPPPQHHEWQTKSLDSRMVSYFLRYDESRTVRLYLLAAPSDKRFWHPWTAEEIADSERDAARGGIFALWLKQAGEGEFLPEAFFPENRRQRFMGELPHQWVRIYGRCAYRDRMERWIKFCDGIATEIGNNGPTHEAGFFDDAGEF